MADVKPLKLDSGIISQMSSGDTLPVANGGTGATTLTSNGVLLGNTTSAITATTAGTTGQVLVGVTSSAPVFGNWLPIAKYKSADETVTSSNTLQDDDHLSFAIGASEVWAFLLIIRGSGATSGGMKWAFTVPSGATSRGHITMPNTTGADQDLTASAGASGSFGLTTGYQISGYVANSTTAGNFTFQWAQQTSNGSGTTIKRGSTLTAWRIS